MAFFDTLKQNLMTASQVTMDTAKNTAEILKLKDQIRQDKQEIRSATYKIGEIYRELHSENYEEAYEDWVFRTGDWVEGRCAEEFETRGLIALEFEATNS